MVAIADQLLEHIGSHVQTLDGIAALADFTRAMINQFLRRDDDVFLREKTLARIGVFFDSAGQDVDVARNFAVEAVGIILQIRHRRDGPPISRSEIEAIYAKLEDEGSGPLRGHATEPTRIILVSPPEPERHGDFAALLPAALRYRVGLSVTFFQRWNPRVFRRLPLPFLLSAPFGAALDRVITDKIAPIMLDSRAVRHVGSLYRWGESDSVKFWQQIEEGGHMPALTKTWHLAWDEFRPLKVEQGGKTVMRVTPALKYLRHTLAGVDYTLPEIRGREIDLFASFLVPDYDRDALERSWTKLRQLYEQELDRRFYQDKARSGALRDSLLDCFDPMSPRTGEFLAMLCYRNFPYLTLDFLDAFTHNHGSNPEARQKRVPFLMWYLGLPDADGAREADARWIAEATVRDKQRLQTAEEQAEQERLATMGAKVWS